MFIILVLSQHFINRRGITLSWDEIFSFPYICISIVTSIGCGLSVSYGLHEKGKNNH